MADFFKLLSRSTKLQKGTAAVNSTDIIISSEGTPAQTLPVSNASGVQHTKPNAGRGKKRKRGVAQSTERSQNAPNFFAERNDDEDERLYEDTISIQRTEQDNSHARETSVSSRSLTQDERKKILKGQKLKVTAMARTNESRNKDKKKSPQSQYVVGFEALFPDPLTSFIELRSKYSISRRLLENLETQGYKTPTAVQLGALPLLLGNDADKGLDEVTSSKESPKSHVDLLTVSPTGSGKTLAFLIPIIQQLVEKAHTSREPSESGSIADSVQAIIVAPTHELVDQIVNEAKKLCNGTGIKAAAMKKGMIVAQESLEVYSDAVPEQANVVKAQILVSTPLVLVNANTDGESNKKFLPSVRFLVLDEADVLLDPLFREQTLGVWESCKNPDLQVTLWSATIGSSIEKLAQDTIIERHHQIKARSKRMIVRLVAGLKDSALPTVSHKLVYCASEQGKLLAIRQLLHPSTATDSHIAALRPPFIVFTQTIPRASALHSELLYDIPVEAGGSNRIAVLHSSLSETARSNIMAGFRKGEIWVMITTDLLARGIDFRGVNGVVNYDIPNTGAAYIHRAGRTGRAGREGGIAVTLYTKEDIPYVKNVANVIAASEKASGKPKGNTDSSIQQWLLDALPDVSKRSKKELKKRGVEVRRPSATEGPMSKEARRTRISTKTGYDRRKDNRRREIIAASKQRLSNSHDESDGSDDEWGGFD